MNIFDALQDGAFDVVTTTMGYDATWLEASPVQTAPVLLRKPTAKDFRLDGVEYAPFNHFIEFREGYFPGLVEAVRQNTTQTLRVNGIDYWCRTVEAAYDGKTFRILTEKAS